MRTGTGLLIVALCAVYSVQAWKETLGPLHVEVDTGLVPQKYHPLTGDDKQATHKALAFVNFIKIVPQMNPLQLASLGPYNFDLPDDSFYGTLRLTNIAVNGLKNLALSDLEVRLYPTRVDFNVSVPQVRADVSFELQATLSNQRITINGQVSATLNHLKASAAVGAKVEFFGPNQVLQVNSADVVADLGQLKLDMNMDQYSEDVRVIALQILQNPKRHQSTVNDITWAVIKAVNQELTLLSANEIIKYLLGSARA